MVATRKALLITKFYEVINGIELLRSIEAIQVLVYNYWASKRHQESNLLIFEQFVVSSFGNLTVNDPFQDS